MSSVISPPTTQRQAGHYGLKKFVLRRFGESGSGLDLRLIVHTFNIVESMSNGAIRGSAVVYDSQDIIKNLPLRGEEYLEIQYEDYFGRTHTDHMFVYSISDVKYANEKSQAILRYVINFVSAGRFFSETFKVRKAYRQNALNSGIISGYVNEVYEEYFRNPLSGYVYPITPKQIEIESTTGQTHYVIPSLSPEQTMHFFARRAYNEYRNTQTFRFFEARDKYYFATNEYMSTVGVDIVGNSYGQVDPSLATAVGIEEASVPIFRMNYLPDISPDRQNSIMYELINIHYGTKVDTIEDINFGGYRRRAWEIDLLNGAVNSIDYNHYADFQSNDLQLPHTQAFIDNRMTRFRETYIPKDYASLGAQDGLNLRPNQNYPEIYNRKGSYFYHHDRNKITAKIYGRNSIFAGSVISLELFEHSASGDLSKDNERSGYYLVESVNNIFFESVYTQELVLTRNGIGK